MMVRLVQFLLTAANLGASIILLAYNLFFTEAKIRSTTFLWSLIYLTLALSLCHLYVLYMSNKIDDWYDVDSIKSITNLSIVCLLLCTLALIAQIATEYLEKKSFTFFLDNDGIFRHPIIPLAGILVSSLFLLSSSIKFKNYVILCKSVDLQPVPRTRPNYRTTDLSA